MAAVDAEIISQLVDVATTKIQRPASWIIFHFLLVYTAISLAPLGWPHPTPPPKKSNRHSRQNLVAVMSIS